MKRAVRSPSANDAVLLWSACVLALCAGYYVAFGLLGAAIDVQHGLTGRISAMALANAAALAQRPALERAQRVIDDRLRALELHADRPTTVARFIRAAAHIATAHHVKLVAIDERGTAVSQPLPPRPERQSGNADGFEAIPLDVTLSGTYRSLLATIVELAQASVTMQIEVAEIERTAATGSVAADPLTARLHIVLQRLADNAPLISTPRSLPEDQTIHARPY